MDQTPTTPTITPRQFADLKQVPIPTVYRWIREGWIPVSRRGRRILIDRHEAERFELPVGVVPVGYRGMETMLTRSDLLWGAVATVYVGAHGKSAA